MKPKSALLLLFFVSLLIFASPLRGEENHESRLEQLNSQAWKAYQDGRYKEGISFAEDAYQYARKRFGDTHLNTIVSMNNLATLYRSQGRYGEAEPLYTKAVQLCEKVHGKENSYTITSMNNLALLYQSQGRYGEAEPLYIKALQLREKVHGKEHANTITSMNNLAALYQSQSRYGEAEPLCTKALQLRKKVLGKEHANTITSMNNLATLYQSQGRYGEAEPLLRKALQLSEKVRGKEHANTITSMNNLAALYNAQSRYGEAESLYTKAMQLCEKVHGKEHSDTIRSMNNLAALYNAQGRYGEAESLLTKAVQIYEKVRGKEHPDTICSMNNLAALYQSQGRYGEAEPLLRKALQLSEKVRGKEHANTITSMNNLAGLYNAQSRYGEAKPLYTKALQLCEKVLGREHPHTIDTGLNYIYLLVNKGSIKAAFRLLKRMEGRLLSRSFQELYTTSTERIRRLYLKRISKFQDMVFTFALDYPTKEHNRYAADVVLRWKQVYAEERAFQHRLMLTDNDPELKQLRDDLSELRSRLGRAIHHQNTKDEVESLREELRRTEAALRAKARVYRSGLEISGVNIDQVLARLPEGSGLIEFRRYFPVDFKKGKFGDSRWAAYLLISDIMAEEEVFFADLGEADGTSSLSPAELYKWLFGKFEAQIKGLKRLYIAPDGSLNLIPFARLPLPDKKYMAQRQEIIRVQTGRDLLLSPPVNASNILVAVGGVDYGKPALNKGEDKKEGITYEGSGYSNPKAATELRDGLAYLRESLKEAQIIADIYEQNCKEGKSVVYKGSDATEQKLKTMKDAPGILHLSTHGFYLSGSKTEKWRSREPLILSGLAMTGANRGLYGLLDPNGDDGLLYSLEVIGLNLRGTELVSLSACDTGKGVIDYSEGIYGLVRAFRTAGAESVLMTLRPVGDRAARDFMVKFYYIWLSSKEGITPGEALHLTRLHFINHPKEAYQDPNFWSPYVLVGR